MNTPSSQPLPALVVELHYYQYYHDHTPRYNPSMHTHPFWQLEWFIKGSCQVEFEDGGIPLQPEQLLLIPPETGHGFIYPQQACSWYSLKFSMNENSFLSGKSGLVIEGTDGASHQKLKEGLRTILSNQGLANEKRLIIAGQLLGALLNLHFHVPVNATESEFAKAVRTFVSQANGRHIAVSELAKSVGYSVSHTSALFRQESGGQSLKTYIDEERAKVAKRLLAFSDQSIAAIADQLDFPDVFSFSHFFKRKAGHSPRDFRQASNAPD